MIKSDKMTSILDDYQSSLPTIKIYCRINNKMILNERINKSNHQINRPADKREG